MTVAVAMAVMRMIAVVVFVGSTSAIVIALMFTEPSPIGSSQMAHDGTVAA
jgi:hypothetical protein